MTSAFPLAWPSNRPRRPASDRKAASFGKATRRSNSSGQSWSVKEQISVAAALDRLQGELDALRARYAVVSSNVETRLDGRPRSGGREPDDPGVAVYFQIGGKPHCMPCDTYNRVADNIAAVAAHINATRAIERHGVASVAEMFSGFVALPAPKTWQDILGFSVGDYIDKERVEAAFRKLARSAHPDAGGDHEKMAELNRARDMALREIAS